MKEQKEMILVSEEKELENLHRLKRNKETICLRRHLLITEKTLKNIKDYPIHTNGHEIYVKKETEGYKELKKPFQFVEEYIKINTIEDFEKIRTIEKGIVVVSLENNLENFKLKAISLEDFTGTLIFLGNQRCLRKGILEATDGVVGLFSKLHPYTNIIFKDLRMEQIELGQAMTSGVFIGKREKIAPGVFGSPEGFISFENCHATSCNFINEPSSFPFLGEMNYSVETKNSTFKNLRSLTSYFWDKKFNNQLVAQIQSDFDPEFMGTIVKYELKKK